MREMGHRSQSHLGSHREPGSKDRRTLPPLIALRCFHAITLMEAISVFRGFLRSLRCLAIGTAVARPAVDGPHPVQLRPICLCNPTGDARPSFLAPFDPLLPWIGRHCSRRSKIGKLERLH